jgi:predicted DNA-binding transcriptional regulator YafY
MIHNIEKWITILSILLKGIENRNKISFSELSYLLNTTKEEEILFYIESMLKLLGKEEEIIYSIENEHSEKYLNFYINFPISFYLKPTLNSNDLSLLGEILNHHPDLLEKIISKLNFISTNSNESIMNIKEQLEIIINHNINSIDDPNAKRREVIIYYKKPFQSIELKKIIPIAIKEIIQDVYYIAAYDINNIDTLKIYRLDRIIRIYKILETALKIDYNEKEIEINWNNLRALNKNSQMIKFAYHPQIELNFKNTFEFEQLKNKIYKINNEDWYVGQIRTAFPDAFLEKVIPYAKLIYIIEPKDLNKKIAEYFKKLYDKI